MNMLQELLATNHYSAFDFFSTSLRESMGKNKFRENEFVHVVSVLAHFSQVSRFSNVSVPAPCNLSEIFDRFVIPTDLMIDAEILETAGAQTLFLVGFFRDQMRVRHNVAWYDKIGQSFYDKACQYEKMQERRILFNHMAESFPFWAIMSQDLSRELRDRRYLLRS